MKRPPSITRLCASIVLFLALSACAGGDGTAEAGTVSSSAAVETSLAASTTLMSSTDTPSTTGVEGGTASDLLPSDIREGGVLKVGTSLQWPPFDYEDENGNAVGIDIDIVTAIAEELGLEAEFTNIKFPSIVPSVSSGRFHVGVNQLNDTETRREEVNFVDYFVSSLGVLAQEGQADDVDPTDLCGHNLAVTQGSSQEELAYQMVDDCAAAGAEELVVEVYPESAATILAVSSGQAEIFITNVTTGSYAAEQPGSGLEVVEGLVPNTDSLSGMVVAKGNEELALAIQAALQAMIDGGRYESILADWDQVEQGVEKATINEGNGFSD